MFVFLAAGLSFGGVHASDLPIYKTGSSMSGIRDFREVLAGILYRGGANNGRASLNKGQLNSLCEKGVSSAVYLYSTGFSGPSTTSCSNGSTAYQYLSYQGEGLKSIHRLVYQSIKTTKKPVFIHCWYGIHATGLVSATALMQFCDASPDQAVAYWRIGVPPSLQYQKVIDAIRSFRSNQQSWSPSGLDWMLKSPKPLNGRSAQHRMGGAGNCSNSFRERRLAGPSCNSLANAVVGSRKSVGSWRPRLRSCSKALEKNSLSLRMGPPA